MSRPHPLQGFERSADYRLTGLIDVALRADAALDAHHAAVASLAVRGSKTAAERYQPLIVAQRWTDSVHEFPRALRRLHDEARSRDLALAASRAYDRVFPGADFPISLRALAVEGGMVIALGDDEIIEVRMDEDAAVWLLTTARDLARAIWDDKKVRMRS